MGILRDLLITDELATMRKRDTDPDTWVVGRSYMVDPTDPRTQVSSSKWTLCSGDVIMVLERPEPVQFGGRGVIVLHQGEICELPLGYRMMFVEIASVLESPA